MNPDHYPPEPLHYQAPNHVEIDGRPVQLTTLHVMLAWGLIDYWLVSVVVHILRAGAKDGESRTAALANAFTCFAKWFQFHGHKAPFYSAELDRLQARIRELERAEDDRGIAEAVRQMNDPAWPPNLQVNDKLRDENARLQSRIAELESELTRIRTMAERVEVFQDELAAATVARIRTVAPTLDTVAVEWTDAELAEWLTANMGEPDHDGPRLKQWQWSGDRWYVDAAWSSTGWHGLVFSRVDTAMPGFTATEAARILNATKPDPFAELLEVSDDVALEAWLTDRYGEPVSDQLDCGVGSATIYRWHDADRNLVCATWFYGWQKWQLPRGGNVNAREAARTLHRILTGAAP